MPQLSLPGLSKSMYDIRPKNNHCWLFPSLELERAGRYRKNTIPDAKKKVVARVWHALWVDSKMIFDRQKAVLTQADVHHLFEKKGMDPNLNYRVVPKNPDAEWGVENAEIVPKNVRNVLVSAFLKRNGEDAERYHEVLARFVVI